MVEKTKEEKHSYTIEELNQYIIAADRLIDYYVNEAMMGDEPNSSKASKYIHLREKLMNETEKLLDGLSL